MGFAIYKHLGFAYLRGNFNKLIGALVFAGFANFFPNIFKKLLNFNLYKFLSFVLE